MLVDDKEHIFARLLLVFEDVDVKAEVGVVLATLVNDRPRCVV